MALRGTSDRYGSLARAIHWIAAVATLLLLALGVTAASASSDEARAAVLRYHVPLGALVFALTILRIVWWCFDRRPGDPAGQPRWRSLIARINHRVMIALTFLLGVSGTGLLVRSHAAPILFAGAPGPLPDFTRYFQLAVHGTAALVLAALLVLHVLAALDHQFIRRSRVFARIGWSSDKSQSDSV